MSTRAMSGAYSSAVVGLSVVLLCFSCAVRAPEHDAASSIDLNAVTYPLDAFDLTDAELATVTRARYALTQRCVGEFGEKIPVLRHAVARVPEDDRYGLANEDTARSWAYSADGPAPDAIPWEVAIAPTSRLFTVVNGVDSRGRPAGVAGLPDGGCLAHANRILEQGTAPTTDNPIPELDDRAWRASRQAPEVRDAAVEWQRCMARDGYDYANPVEASYFYWSQRRAATNAHLTERQRRQGVPPSDEERRAALADVRCKHRSGFLRAWIDADIAAQRTLVAENSHRLTEHRRTLEHLVHNAEDVLAS